ncbi:hypothetical protein NE865_08182 [Phthorimaea operculella]|nr:hypothetical protein NE865_08182 [Phthorimaea operculella]
MGARIPPNERPRRGGLSCEFCGRPVQSEGALAIHQATLHSQALKEKARAKPATPKPSKVQKPETAKVDKINTKDKAGKEVEGSNKTPQKKSSEPSATKTTAKPKVDTAEPKVEAAKPKVEVAKAKIEATTSAKSKLEVAKAKIETATPANAENAPDIIQPILMELCIYCDKKFPKPHNCPNRPNANFMTYTCLGCQEKFSNNKLFDSHVPDVHGDIGESLFFPSDEEFATWKDEMEDQTACRYTLMGEYSSKQIYQCSEYTDNDTKNTVILCPSSIVVTKFPKGLQVHFYPTHYDHEYEEYELHDRYKTFSVSELIHQAGSTNDSPDEDLYIQFKTLMDNIVLGAAKLNIDALKTLMKRAKDMETILQDYDEDKEIEFSKGRFTISLSSRTVNSEGNSSDSSPARNRKRTIEENGVTPAKKIRKSAGDTKTPVKSASKKTFSLADDKDSDNILKELDGGNVQTDKTMQSPSFTDAYKDFIMKASKTPVNKTGSSKTTAKTEKNTAKKKNVVKTKMGQFKGPSPKKIAKRNSIGSIGTVKDIEYEVREREEDCNILVLKI